MSLLLSDYTFTIADHLLTCIMMIGVMLYLVSDSEMKAVYSFLWNCGALSFVSFRCMTTEVALLLSPPKNHIKRIKLFVCHIREEGKDQK